MMRKTRLMRGVEERYHRPLEKLLREMYKEERKSLPDIADELGVSRSTVYYWLPRSGFKLERMALAADETLEVKKGR